MASPRWTATRGPVGRHGLAAASRGQERNTALLSRRALLVGPTVWVGGAIPVRADPDTGERLAALERQAGGKLGVAILDTGSGTIVGHRLDEPFPLCSTHKVLSAAFVLARVDAGQDRLDRRVGYGAEALIAYSPVTEPHAGREGLTLAELCAAAVTVSDNTAANLLLDSFGGPAALTAHLRGLGDAVTRLDRREPELNEARPGDPRDTTTPRSMATLLRAAVLGTALSPASRTRLQGWMLGCQTGFRKVRAGVPADWRVGDKTGSGGGTRHASNDVAVIWRPDRAPFVVTAYTIDTPGDDAGRDATLAEVGRIAAALLDN